MTLSISSHRLCATFRLYYSTIQMDSSTSCVDSSRPREYWQNPHSSWQGIRTDRPSISLSSVMEPCESARPNMGDIWGGMVQKGNTHIQGIGSSMSRPAWVIVRGLIFVSTRGRKWCFLLCKKIQSAKFKVQNEGFFLLLNNYMTQHRDTIGIFL